MRGEGVHREGPGRVFRVLPSNERMDSQILRSVDESAARGQQSSKLVMELIGTALAQAVRGEERAGEPCKTVVPGTERGSKGFQVVARVREMALSSRRKENPLAHRAEVPNQVGGSVARRSRLEASNDVARACRPRAAYAWWPR